MINKQNKSMLDNKGSGEIQTEQVIGSTYVKRFAILYKMAKFILWF